MRNKIWDKRIPSIFGLLFLALSIGAATWFGQNLSQLRSRASAGETPKNVQISNITGTSVTVSYVTDDKVTASIAYGDASASGQVVMDDRDKGTGTPAPHQVHFITLTNLTPGTKYYFAIQSGTTSVTNNGLPFEATTAATGSASMSNQPPLTGTVNLPDGTIPLEGIIYVSADNSQMLSAPLQIDGSYSLPLNSMLNSTLNLHFEFKPETILHLKATNGTGQSMVTLLAANSNPVPLITLSKDYDFTTGSLTPTENPTASGSATASPSGTLTPTDVPTVFPVFNSLIATGPAILTPKDEQKFNDRQPTFSGTALPNESILITISSDQPIQTTVQADSLGNWEFRPNTPLASGEHFITVISKDANGVLQTIKRSFTVYAEGSQFNEPSVPPLNSPTPTVTVIPSPTVQPTLEPTLYLSPTASSSPTIDLTQAWSLTQAYSLTQAWSLTQAASQTTIDPASLTATAIASRNTKPPGDNYTLFIAGLITLLSITGGLVLFFF